MSKPKAIKFLGTQFSTVTAWGSGVNITGISNASPAVVTKTAHGLADGDVVKISAVTGMTEVNGEVAVVDVVTADTFRLLGIDSTQWGVYASGGTYAVATFSSSCNVTNYSGDTGSTGAITTDTNCGKSYDVGSTDVGTVTIQFNHAGDDFRDSLEAARKTRDLTAIKTVLPASNGTTIDIGYITKVGFQGAANGVWTGSAEMQRNQDRVDL